MKITSDIFGLLANAVGVAKIMGIAELAMEDNEKGTMFRGMADVGGTPVVLLQDIDIDLPFTGLGIQNTSSFIVKEKLAYDNDDQYSVYAQIDTMSNNVKSLDFKGQKFKMSINSAKTNIIRAPKAIKDNDVLAFSIEETEVKTLEQAVRAFSKAELIDIVSDGETITFEIRSGEDGGSFTFTLDNEPIELPASNGDAFVHSYPVKTFLNLVKNSDHHTLRVGQQGVINGSIQDIKTFIFPRRK